MKYYLETETKDKVTEEVTIKQTEVQSLSDAAVLVELGKDNYFHICYHDEKEQRPCKRIKL